MEPDILLGYLNLPTWGGHSTGERVWSDGRVELKYGDQDWRVTAQLGPGQLRQLEEHVRASGLLDMPPVISGEAGPVDAPACDWRAALDGRQVEVHVEGWSDANPPARPLWNLSQQMYQLISRAQRGEVN